MNHYQKSVALDLLGRTREGIRTLVNALGDEFFEKHAKVETTYTLIGSTPQNIYRSVYTDDQYTDQVTKAELVETQDDFIQIRFTIRYVDRFVWGNLNRVFSIHKKDVGQHPDIIRVTEKVVLV